MCPSSRQAPKAPKNRFPPVAMQLQWKGRVRILAHGPLFGDCSPLIVVMFAPWLPGHALCLWCQGDERAAALGHELLHGPTRRPPRPWTVPTERAMASPIPLGGGGLALSAPKALHHVLPLGHRDKDPKAFKPKAYAP